MNLLPRSDFAQEPAYRLFREQGAGRIDIEKIFDAHAGHLPPIENIRGKIADLRALGFADPVKMITSSPAILGLAIENIRGKIADLRALGFADPVKMITSRPAILGYSALRLHFVGTIINETEKGSVPLFRFLINKNPLIAAVAATDRATEDAATLRRAYRLRASTPKPELEQLIADRWGTPVVAAYNAYRPKLSFGGATP